MWQYLFKSLVENLAGAFNVKTIVTLAVVFIFIYKVLSGAEISTELLTIFTVAVTYWLCKKSKRRDDKK